MPLIDDNSKDDALVDVRDNANQQVMCQGFPASYAEATTDLGTGSGKALGETTMAPGDYTLADGQTDGRSLTVGLKSGVVVDVAGTFDHVALVDTVNSRLKAVTRPGDGRRGHGPGRRRFDDYAARGGQCRR